MFKIPHVAEQTSGLFHSANIAELMMHRHPPELQDIYDRTGIWPEDLSGMNAAEAAEMLCDHGIQIEASRLSELLRK